MDCFRTARPVAAADLTAAGQLWPQFAAAREAGFAAVHALPMRLRSQVIGALNLFRATPGALSHEDMRVGQALADVATIGLLQERSTRRSEILHEQLQAALNSRVVIEQAKGKLAERLGLDMDQAFTLLRGYARDRNLRLSDLAQAFIDGSPADFPRHHRTSQPQTGLSTQLQHRDPARARCMPAEGYNRPLRVTDEASAWTMTCRWAGRAGSSGSLPG